MSCGHHAFCGGAQALTAGQSIWAQWPRGPAASLALAAMLLGSATQLAVAADLDVANVTEFRNALQVVLPGDAIILRGGTYALGGQLTQVARSGTAAQPVTIRPRNGELVTITQTLTQNILQISASHVVVQDLRFTGGSRAIRLQSGANFVTLQRNLVRDVPSDGISANDNGATYQGLVIRQNEITNTGTGGSTGIGIYLGCNNSACQVVGAVVEGNHVHDFATAATLASGIVVKPGSWGNTVRDNVVQSLPLSAIGIDVGDASGGAPNTVERNALWNLPDTAIRVGPNVTVRNNLVLVNGAMGILAVPTNAPAQNIRLLSNTVITGGGAALRVNTATGDASLVIANNALYAPSGSALRNQASTATITGNIGIGSALGAGAGFNATGNLAADFVNANLNGAPPADLMLKPGSALLGAGNAAQLPADDFNAVVRIGAPDVGAYRRYYTPVAGWTLAAGFKPLTPPFVDSDGDGLADADDLLPLDAGGQGDVPIPAPALLLLALFFAGALVRKAQA